MLIVIPSVLLIDKDGKDKTGHILTGIYVFALLVFLGCLLVTGMANIICGIYPSLNRELLLIGTALHDIGKLKELETNELGVSEFTPEGNLSGHTLCGIEMLNKAVTEMEEATDPEEYKQVKHMIASHHGLLEHGAIVVPATAEAMVLNNLDLIQYKRSMQKLQKNR